MEIFFRLECACSFLKGVTLPLFPQIAMAKKRVAISQPFGFQHVGHIDSHSHYGVSDALSIAGRKLEELLPCDSTFGKASGEKSGGFCFNATPAAHKPLHTAAAPVSLAAPKKQKAALSGHSSSKSSISSFSAITRDNSVHSKLSHSRLSTQSAQSFSSIESYYSQRRLYVSQMTLEEAEAGEQQQLNLRFTSIPKAPLPPTPDEKFVDAAKLEPEPEAAEPLSPLMEETGTLQEPIDFFEDLDLSLDSDDLGSDYDYEAIFDLP